MHFCSGTRRNWPKSPVCRSKGSRRLNGANPNQPRGRKRSCGGRWKKHGVTLTDRGIEYSENAPFFFVEGDTHEATYLQLLEDVAEHVKDLRHPELLVMYADDRVSPPSINERYRAMRTEGVAMRQLIEEGKHLPDGATERVPLYPETVFSSTAWTLVYGDRVASEAGDFCRAAIKVDPVDPVGADLQRNTFNLLWKLLDEPAESDADERF